MSLESSDGESTLAATGVTRRGQRDVPEPPRGTEIGRYLVTGTLGRGAMGVVLAAYDADLDRRVAIKLAFERIVDGDRRHLLGEAQAMAKIEHPNVARVYDVGVFDDRLYVAMELIDGVALRKWVGQGERSIASVLDVYIAAARGLGAAHDAGVVHRDFKPDNVMVAVGPDTRPTRVCVVDFGIATARADAGGRTRQAIRGTPAYMSPEQHAGTDVDGRSDQFSFCVALFEAIEGRPPLGRLAVAAVGAAVVAGETSAATSTRMDPRVRRVVMRGLARDRQDRFASMGELIAALEAARRRRWPWAAAVAGTAVLAAVSWSQLRAGESRGCEVGQPRVDTIAALLRDATIVAPGAASAALVEATDARVRDELDAYGRAWATAFDEVCHAAADPNDSVARIESACLEDRFSAYQGVVQSLTRTPVAVDLVDGVVATLPPLATCAGADAVGWADNPTPTDPEVAARVNELRARLREVTVLRRSGKLDEAGAALDVLIADARATGFGHVIAATLRERAAVAFGARRVEDALALLDEALAFAVQGGHDLQAANIAAVILGYLPDDAGRLDEAARWSKLGHAWLERHGSDPAVASDLAVNYARSLLARGEIEAADEAMQHAERVTAEGFGADSVDLARVRASWAEVARAAGDQDRARALAEASRSVIEAKLGPDHPEVLHQLQLEAADAVTRGDTDRSVALSRDVATRAEALWGPQNRASCAAWYNVALLEGTRGRAVIARDALARSRVACNVTTRETESEFAIVDSMIAFADGDVALARELLWGMSAALDPSTITAPLRMRIDLQRLPILVALGDWSGALAVAEAVWAAPPAGPPPAIARHVAAMSVLAAVAAEDRGLQAMWIARGAMWQQGAREDAILDRFAHAAVRGHDDADAVAKVAAERAQLVAWTHERHPYVAMVDAWLAGRWPRAAATPASPATTRP